MNYNMSIELAGAIAAFFGGLTAILGAVAYFMRQTSNSNRDIIAGLQTRLTEVAKRNDDLERKSDQENERLQSRVDALNQRLEEAIVKLAHAEGIIETTYHQIAMLRDQVNAAHQVIGARDEAIKNLTIEKDTFISTLKIITEERDQLRQELEETKRQNSELIEGRQASMAALTEKIAAKDGEIAGLRAIIAGLQDQIEGLNVAKAAVKESQVGDLAGKEIKSQPSQQKSGDPLSVEVMDSEEREAIPK